MRKTLPIDADGRVVIPAELVRELAGNGRELMLEQRDSCILLTPLKISLTGGKLPELLAAFHESEKQETLLESAFTRGSTGPAQFQGDLEVLALNDVMMFLSASKKSGALVLDVDPPRAIFFVQGMIVFAVTADPGSCFAAFLLRRRQATESDLGGALHDQGDPYAALHAHLRMAPGDWVSARRHWMEAAIFACFAEKSGNFKFIDGELAENRRISNQYTTTNFIMEGARREDEMARVKQHLPPADAILRISEEISASVKLTETEDAMLKKINGFRNFEDAAAAAGLDEMDAAKAIYTLISSGLVQVAQPEPPAPPPSAAAPVKSLHTDEIRDLLEVIAAFNDIFGAAYQALKLESGEKALMALNAFFKQQQMVLFDGASFSTEGTLREEQLLKNLVAVDTEDRREVLVQGLNELLYFVLYALKTGVNPEVERGIIEMARAVLKPQ